MSDHDFERCFLDVASMADFTAIQADDAKRFGATVKALPLSNREYQHRFNRFGKENTMKPPPESNIHNMPGFLVVRKLGTQNQYETWMSEEVFRELYEAPTDCA